MRELKERLHDVLDAIVSIEEERARGQGAFNSDRHMQVWMVHHIQVIGEAIRAALGELRLVRPGFPWKRHLLVHHYFAVYPAAV